jgi:hypothetical protein
VSARIVAGPATPATASRPEQPGRRHQDDLRDHDHAAPVDDVRHRAADEPEHQRGRRRRRLHERHDERRVDSVAISHAAIVVCIV